ncbi:EamA family transporter [Catellatospora tritici]|uniref:EamA family transporter n=1 Tax=Catellatospora tritici TaxID=2851566 RepID=UPI001C2D2184|nr:EamA family transporter [Catellatospora tritici]MBV1856583.1 EamA family transporter [Catellatospora tritici]
MSAPPSGRALFLLCLPMLGAAALWGAVGGVVSGLGVAGVAAAAVVETTTGLALLGLGAVAGRRPSHVFTALGVRRIAALGAIEAVNVACYYLALQWAPVGPAMAVHLLAPVLLAGAGLLRGTVTAVRRTFAAIGLTALALLFLGFGGDSGAPYPRMVLGLLLSLASAGCLALFVSMVRVSAHDVAPMSAAGAQMLASGLLLSPSLLAAGDGRAVGGLALIGLVLFAPACWLYWVAMRRLSPITASTVLLAEPLFGAAVAYAVYGQRPTLWHGAAALLIIAATYLTLGAPAATAGKSLPVQ